MDDYKTRLISEYHELKDKYDKLCAFIMRVEEGSSPIHDDYPVAELYQQREKMKQRLDSMKTELKIKGGDLS